LPGVLGGGVVGKRFQVPAIPSGQLLLARWVVWGCCLRCE